jgi:pimeloyl-ACP methyl ester carboxylesterase
MALSLISLTVAGGRVADVLVGGAPAGPALVGHHGTPSDASLWMEWDALATARGLRLIALSRPGYATATRLPGRSVAGVAADVAAILERLDVPWFVTAGWSGGGPHALACAQLGAPCRGIATLAGVAPFDAPDLDFLTGMGADNHAEFGAARTGETALRAWLEANAEPLRSVSGGGLVEAFGDLVDEPDRAVLAGGFAERMAAVMRRALGAGFDGWIDDDLAFTRPWGFELAAIAAPVTVWQGDRDRMVPLAHGRWLAANIPAATARIVPGRGHIDLVTAHRAEILDDLLARAGVETTQRR